jgi:hypothetical protein
MYVGIFFWGGLVGLVGLFLGLLISLAVIAAYYYSVFVRPSIDRPAKQALGTLLRTVSIPRASPQGIGGWLVLPVIGLVIGLIQAGHTLITQYWPIFRDGTWAELTTPGSEVYHHLWGPMLTFEVIGLVVGMLLALATLVLLFRKSKKTPAFAIALRTPFIGGKADIPDPLADVANDPKRTSINHTSRRSVGTMRLSRRPDEEKS